MINDTLRSISLNIQGAKTKIVSGADLREEVIDDELDEINSAIDDIADLVEAKDKEATKQRLKDVDHIVARFTVGVPESVSDLTGRENRLFRRCLTLHGTCFRARMKKAALASLSRIPDKRVLDSVLRYLRKLPYRHHDEIVGNLLYLLEVGSIPFPYQAGSILRAIKDFHPSDAKPVASRIRQIGFTKRDTHWYVRQSAIESIASYPYTGQSIARVISKCIDATEPAVQRAGMYFSCVHPDVEHVRKFIAERSHDANPDIARIAIYWWNCINRTEFANKEIDRYRSSYVHDARFTGVIPQLYALRCNPERRVAARVHEIAALRIRKTKSARVRWHAQQLANLTQFANEPPRANGTAQSTQ
ncbi:MAG: hypothetical protein ACFHWZ_04385 [Phycisphaerales bacterium]